MLGIIIFLIIGIAVVVGWGVWESRRIKKEREQVINQDKGWIK